MPKGDTLKITHPELADEWHPDNPLSIEEVTYGMRHIVIWKCKTCQHVWESGLYNRTGPRKAGCPFCAGQAVHSDGRNSLSTTHPEIAKEFHPTLNGEVSPNDITSGSSKKRWWICRSISANPCGHVWETHPYVRTRGIGCPVCSNRPKAVHIDGRNSMLNTHPDLAKEFHRSKNGRKNPKNTIAGTASKLWWKCTTISESPCGHEWQTTGNSRTVNSAGCPACANQAIHKDGRNSMAITHPELACEFHPTMNGDLTPKDLIAATGKKIYWVCSKISPKPCGTIWKTRRLIHTEAGETITTCPVCSNRELHEDGRNSLANLFPDLSTEFHPTKNYPITPENIAPGSRNRIYWVCNSVSENPCGHEWSTFVFKRTTGLTTGCPACSKGGFDPSKPGQYYVLRILNEFDDIILYKGGISNQFEKRFSQHKQRFGKESRSKNWKLILDELIEFDVGQKARDLETSLLAIEDIRAPNIENVSSELFLENPLIYARDNGLIV